MDEVIYEDELSENGRKRRTRPEQKSVVWTRDIVCKVTSTGQLVLDPLGGTLYAAVGSQFLERHRRFVGCDENFSCLLKSVSRLPRFMHLCSPGSEVEV